MKPTKSSTAPKEDSPFSWGDLFRAYWFLSDEVKWKWLFLTLFLFVIYFYSIVPPLIIGSMVDFLNSGSSLSSFHLYALILGISFVIASFLRLSTKNALGNIRSELSYQTKVKGFEKLMDFSLSWHLEEGAGAKAQRIKNGVGALRTLSQKLTSEILPGLASIIGIMTVFLFLRPQYVIFFLLYIFIFWLILVSFYKQVHKENNLYYSSDEEAGGSYVEGLSNILTIKTLGAGSDFKVHIDSKERQTKDREVVIRKLQNNFWKTFQAFNGLCYGIFLFLVGQDVVRHEIGPGSLVIFYGYLQNLIGKASDVAETYESIIDSKSAIGRMMSIFWTKPLIAAGTKTLPKNWDAISLSQIEFTYKGRVGVSSGKAKTRRAISRLSISIPRFAKIGVVGKTGSGKSTLAKILAGLYPISSGQYSIGGVSFYQFSHEEQTKQITLVLQETEVFNLSLRENITLLRKTNPNLLAEAISISQLRNVVAKLPEGLETVVGEKGYHLSGGERQRIGIARAIYKNSPIIILDEATSSLDSKTESLIQEALETKLKDKTIISIAHRVSTLQKTDIIYVFSDGAIVENGTFADLSTNEKTKFFELYRGQQHPTPPTKEISPKN